MRTLYRWPGRLFRPETSKQRQPVLPHIYKPCAVSFNRCFLFVCIAACFVIAGGLTVVVGGRTAIAGGLTAIVGGDTVIVRGLTAIVGGHSVIVRGLTVIVGGHTVIVRGLLSLLEVIL